MDISRAHQLHKTNPIFNVKEICVTAQYHKDLQTKHDLTMWLLQLDDLSMEEKARFPAMGFL